MESEGTGDKFKKVTNVDSLGDSSDDFDLDDAIEEFTKEQKKIEKLSDDFDLDDAIEEFTKEQNKIEKLSDDEIDFLVEEFAEACSSDSNSSVTNKLSPMTALPDNVDYSEPFVEDSKAPDSDNVCLIVKNKSIVKISTNQDLNVLPEKNMAKLSPSEPYGEAVNDNEFQKVEIDAECTIGQQLEEQEIMHHISTKPNKKIDVSISKIIQTVVVGDFNSEILEKRDVQMNQDAELNSGQTNKGLNDANETSLDSTNNHSSNNNDIMYSQSKAVGDSNIINKLHNDVNSYAENICLENFEKENVERNTPVNSYSSPVNSYSHLCSTEENVDNTSINSLNSLRNFSCDNDLVNVVMDERNNLHSSLKNEKTLTTNETSDVEESITSDLNVDNTDSNTDFCILPPVHSATLDDGSNSKFDLDDIEVNICLGDIVSRVCALHRRISKISTQNGDAGAIEDFENEDSVKNKLGIITSVNSCSSIQNSLPSIKEKFLDISSHKSLEETKKRKLEDVKKPSSITKKLKEDDETFIGFGTLILKILKLIAFSDNFKKFKDATLIKKSLLDYLSLKASRSKFEKSHRRIMLLDTIRDMENNIHQLKDELLWLHSERAKLLSSQEEHFQLLKYKTEIPTRTVAVNVKIFRECDVPSNVLNEVKKVTCPGQESLRASAAPNS
ncbi:uncharacterized protein TNCT_92871 [Trichonephila clavata]|uniref:Uncharacterized protein n=1 Tax=Trichonephila clavata TaxID=2740835 RepID=A0A8X6HSN5_TRICU|nr:uncharacterized protein TNCT_92871 [Trichonephila clavata]